MRNLIAEDTGASGDLGFDGDHAETFITARQTESIERLVKVVDVRALAQEQNVVTNAEFLGVLLYVWSVWTVTNEREYRVRLLGKELGENVDKESLILLRHETTHMANQNIPSAMPSSLRVSWRRTGSKWNFSSSMALGITVKSASLPNSHFPAYSLHAKHSVG